VFIVAISHFVNNLRNNIMEIAKAILVHLIVAFSLGLFIDVGDAVVSFVGIGGELSDTILS